MLSIQIDTKSLEQLIYQQFNNIKLSFFASQVKSSFPLCTFHRCCTLIRYSRVNEMQWLPYLKLTFFGHKRCANIHSPEASQKQTCDFYLICKMKVQIRKPYLRKQFWYQCKGGFLICANLEKLRERKRHHFMEMVANFC